MKLDCPLCGYQEPQIDAVGTIVEGDNSPNSPTKVYYVQQATCRNPKCTNSHTPYLKIKHLQYPEPKDGEEWPKPIVEPI